MSEADAVDTLCPNCRTPFNPKGDAPCVFCGWLPLRATELQFLDQNEVSCPNCGRQRALSDPVCPHCGSAPLLESLSSSALNFRISNMIFCTTLVAFCCAIARFSVVMGLVTFCLSAACVFHTAVLIRERRSHRYPMNSAVTWRLFGMSVTGVVAGVVVFCVASLVGGFMFGAIITPFLDRSYHTFLVVVGLVLVVTHGTVGFLVCRRDTWVDAGTGAGLALASATFTGALHPMMDFQYLGWLFLLPAWTAFSGATLTASRRGRSVHAMAYLWGHCTALSLVGMWFSWHTWRGGFSSGFLLLGLLLTPAVLTVLSLRNVWSWEDAFPRALRYAMREPVREPTRIPLRSYASAEGIEFEEVSDDGIDFGESAGESIESPEPTESPESPGSPGA